MIVHMIRTTSPDPLTARRAAVAGIVEQLNGAVRLLRCAATGRMVRQGVSMTHLHVMWRLEESGELTMSRLADYLDVALSNATGLVDRMEERGLVERTRVSDDRRVVLVRLTPAGQDLLDEVQIVKRDLINAILERLDERQLTRLHRGLRDFRVAVGAEEAAHADHFGTGRDHPHDDHPHQHLHEPASRADGREYTAR
jgi:DNA-binding MarR family transcriptional regulator